MPHALRNIQQNKVGNKQNPSGSSPRPFKDHRPKQPVERKPRKPPAASKAPDATPRHSSPTLQSLWPREAEPGCWRLGALVDGGFEGTFLGFPKASVVFFVKPGKITFFLSVTMDVFKMFYAFLMFFTIFLFVTISPWCEIAKGCFARPNM